MQGAIRSTERYFSSILGLNPNTLYKEPDMIKRETKNLVSWQHTIPQNEILKSTLNLGNTSHSPNKTSKTKLSQNLTNAPGLMQKSPGKEHCHSCTALNSLTCTDTSFRPRHLVLVSCLRIMDITFLSRDFICLYFSLGTLDTIAFANTRIHQ